MDKKFCLSCGIPLDVPGVKGNSDSHCACCSDEKGDLKSRDEIVKGVAKWFMTWQPNIDEETAAKRADLYLKSMPAWAD